MIRSIPTITTDRIYCKVLGQGAVHGAFAGYTDFTVGLVNTWVPRGGGWGGRGPRAGRGGTEQTQLGPHWRVPCGRDHPPVGTVLLRQACAR